MSVRKLKFELSANSISPQTVQAGGVQFEHNATQAIFVIPNELYTLINGIGENKTVLYRVDAVDGEGGYHVSETIEPLLSADSTEEYHLIYSIPYDVSSIGGTCQLTVVATRMDENSAEEMIYCSETAFIQFSHVSRSSLQHDKFKSELGGILNEAKGYMIESAAINDNGELFVKYANGKTISVGISNILTMATIEAVLKATSDANAAADSANSAAQKANVAADDAAAVRKEVEEGGFIESLKEQNNGEKFKFWAGTQTEYDALETKPENTFCIVVDGNIAKPGKLLWKYIVGSGQVYSDIANILNDTTKYTAINATIRYLPTTLNNLINILLTLDNIEEDDSSGIKTYTYTGDTTHFGLIPPIGASSAMIDYGITLTIEVDTEGTASGTVSVYSVYIEESNPIHNSATYQIETDDSVRITKLMGLC